MTSRIAIRYLAAIAVAALGGCSLLESSDDLDDLAPGTFVFRAHGRYTGQATYHRNTDTELAVASISLAPTGGGLLQVRSDAFLTADAGDRIEPHATLMVDGPFYIRESGVVEIVSAGGDHITGRFRFRFRESGPGPWPGSDISAEGVFRALVDNG